MRIAINGFGRNEAGYSARVVDLCCLVGGEAP